LEAQSFSSRRELAGNGIKPIDRVRLKIVLPADSCVTFGSVSSAESAGRDPQARR
jgi:hypothetical protein